jgi:hypothetical protein
LNRGRAPFLESLSQVSSTLLIPKVIWHSICVRKHRRGPISTRVRFDRRTIGGWHFCAAALPQCAIESFGLFVYLTWNFQVLDRYLFNCTCTLTFCIVLAGFCLGEAIQLVYETTEEVDFECVERPMVDHCLATPLLSPSTIPAAAKRCGSQKLNGWSFSLTSCSWMVLDGIFWRRNDSQHNWDEIIYQLCCEQFRNGKDGNSNDLVSKSDPERRREKVGRGWRCLQFGRTEPSIDHSVRSFLHCTVHRFDPH